MFVLRDLSESSVSIPLMIILPLGFILAMGGRPLCLNINSPVLEGSASRSQKLLASNIDSNLTIELPTIVDDTVIAGVDGAAEYTVSPSETCMLPLTCNQR